MKDIGYKGIHPFLVILDNSLALLYIERLMQLSHRYAPPSISRKEHVSGLHEG